jgi:hypothetical protein
MSDLQNISIVTILHDWTQFYPLFQHHWDTIDYPKDKLEWIIIDDSKQDNSDKIPIDENILYLKVTSDEYLEKITFPNDDDKIIWNYFSKMKILPNGFKRDYAVGMTSHDYVFHLDIDTLYQPNAIKRKLKFLIDNRLECVYCKKMLCYDIYGKQLYKTESPVAGYESTLFHTKDFWKKSGFKWEDITSEAVAFYYNKGVDRQMDNYYDTIKLISIHNMNDYKPIRVTLENMNIKIPDIVNSIIVDDHPLKYDLKDLFNGQHINVIGINSEIIDIINEEKWNTINISHEKNKKEKILIKTIQDSNKEYDICFINTKFPLWNIFDKINFKCVVIESEKNIPQMESILKKKDYIAFKHLYIHKDYLHL